MIPHSGESELIPHKTGSVSEVDRGLGQVPGERDQLPLAWRSQVSGQRLVMPFGIGRNVDIQRNPFPVLLRRVAL